MNTGNTVIKGTDFSQSPMSAREYESAVFSNCNYSRCDLSRVLFTDVIFDTCDLSLAKLSETTFQDATFRNCRMLGMHFDHCNRFGLRVVLENCNLGHSSFYGVKHPGGSFTDCRFNDVDFTGCVLSGSHFDRCDFSGAVFDHADLERCDFSTSINYTIDPELNRLKKARFSLFGLPGLLEKYGIETVPV